MSYNTLLILAVVLAITVSYFQRFIRTNYPDGPRGIPFVGYIPSKKQKLSEQLQQMVSKYGDFFSLTMGGLKVIVLASPSVVDELMVKRGAKYASRPSSSPQAKIVGAHRMVGLEYGDEFRDRRKVVHGLLGMQNSATFLPYQEYESRQTLKSLLERPERFSDEVSRYSASVTFSLLLGSRLPTSDGMIPIAIRAILTDLFQKIRPGYWWADWIPLLEHLPDRLAPWRASAHGTAQRLFEFYSVFYDPFSRRVKSGHAPDCFLKRFLEMPELSTYEPYARRAALAELLGAGSETTATLLQWFFKAAITSPDAVATAKEELDQVVGSNRLPEWEDHANLPYLAAMVEELLRWGSITPMGIFHGTSEADTFRGKDIPAGTTVITHHNAIHHDSRYYPEHERFMPERFLSEKDPRNTMAASKHAVGHYAFGVGRRECPGKHVARASLFILISRLIWAFDIDLGGHPWNDDIVGDYPTRQPAPFLCRIRPRSKEVAEIILAEAEKQDPGLVVEDASQYQAELEKVVEKQQLKF